MQRQKQQRQMEELLERKREELDAREIDLLGRELNIMMNNSTPTPEKRRGKFSKNKLKVCRTKIISLIYSTCWYTKKNSTFFFLCF